MSGKETAFKQVIEQLLSPRKFGLGIAHVLFWIAFALVVLDISRITQSVVTTKPYVFNFFELKSGLGKPSGGNMINLLNDWRTETVGMEQLRGQWTLVVFTILSNDHALGSGSNSSNDAKSTVTHRETLSASMSYLARQLQPRGVRLLLIQLDRKADLDFYKRDHRDGRILSYVHTRPERPWDARLIAASKLQEHPRYYSWSYYPARVWLEREWLRRYFKDRTWQTSLSPTHEFTPIMGMPLYAILDPTGELRWMGSGALAEEIVTTFYKHMGINKFAAPRATHVLSQLYPIEHRTFGKLRVDSILIQKDDKYALPSVYAAAVYLATGVGTDSLPPRKPLDWQEREAIKVPASGKLWMFPRYGGKHVLHKFYPNERKYPW